MIANHSARLCIAGVFAFGVSAFAQTAGQQPAQPNSPAKADKSMAQQVTITGCVQREADYRQAHDAGRGGAAGSGVGVGNEFVLTEASSASSSASSKDEPASATGTSGSSASGSMAYELSGPKEGQLSEYVGRRVELTGKLKKGETDAAGRPTGGATAGKPPSGVDVMSKDLKLREFEVSSVREASGTCAPIK